MKEFTWQPDWKMKRKKKPNVNVIKFGDGYEQRQQNGINNNLRTYDVTFTGAEQRARLNVFLASTVESMRSCGRLMEIFKVALFAKSGKKPKKLAFQLWQQRL